MRALEMIRRLLGSKPGNEALWVGHSLNPNNIGKPIARPFTTDDVVQSLTSQGIVNQINKEN